MSGFAARMQLAVMWETEVLNRLQEYGWTADKFGQAQLPESQRDFLRRVDTNTRWLPDIIAHKRLSGDEFLACYIDAKGGEKFRETGNHDIESRSLKVLLEWKQFTGYSVLVVTRDWMVHRVEAIDQHCWDGPFCGRGSGTPFKLWPATTTEAGINIPWDSIMVSDGDRNTP